MKVEACVADGIARLTPGVVEVCSLWLDQPTATLDRLSALLSTDERDRAERFVFDRDRRHFVVCRGALRVALGAYLQCDPMSVRFQYGPYGKPSLASESDVVFNVSHASRMSSARVLASA